MKRKEREREREKEEKNYEKNVTCIQFYYTINTPGVPVNAY